MNKVTHFEIPTADKAKSRAFYSGVFGWRIEDVPVQMNGGTGSYTTAMTAPVNPQTMAPTEPGAINGALVERTGQIKAPVITITVDSIDDSLKKITQSGGKVVEGRQTIEQMGHYAYATDPDGNVIGLWENLAR
jgi:uncharacterized protein